MDLEFDMETEEILKELHKMSKNTPKLVKKHLKNVGKNMTKTIKKTAKQLVGVGKKQKNPRKKYHNRFKTSKVLEDTGTYAVGTYNSSPHAHLIEYGYKTSKGYVPGKYPITKGVSKYCQNIKKDLEDMLDKVIDEGGF
ncbi:HK97 gp10 family phage protein [Streptobacillus canis]|uniref:HK97 gp10 family phage protein n=1 Tax=Streptobacillus canis TaxID=2678686 RepID=UPI0012E1ABEA|nr:HK97 gp10 family phage protein [Streptobacillus canis]